MFFRYLLLTFLMGLAAPVFCMQKTVRNFTYTDPETMLVSNVILDQKLGTPEIIKTKSLKDIEVFLGYDCEDNNATRAQRLKHSRKR
ncbi:MAG TPA: hypothetical protein VHO47_03795 [Candidatus Babeliales bacterium]|nr:hypothetical protein [Candidatus Babeliales bacterium]